VKKQDDIKMIRGRRLYLRPVLKSDIKHLLRWINDEEVTQYLLVHEPLMEADENAWFDDLPKRKGKDYIFSIVLNSGRIIGTMGIHKISWRDRTATTGALIGDKACWGKGYGTEAKMLVLRYAFQTLNLRKIRSSVVSFNMRSYAYLLKCGYVVEGQRRREFYRNGRYWDEILLAVYSSAWKRLWKRECDKFLNPKDRKGV